jgi:Fe-S-cluster containining protein
MNKGIKLYNRLRKRVDRDCQRLGGVHKEQMVCAEGCCGCCVNLGVFPVEFFAILGAIRAEGKKNLEFDESASCGFLDGGLCSIYEHRPMICRTHGHAIVFLDDDVEEPTYSVSFCEKNFMAAKGVEFGAGNTLNIDELNGELFAANLAFLEEIGDSEFEAWSRIQLSQLVTELGK